MSHFLAPLFEGEPRSLFCPTTPNPIEIHAKSSVLHDFVVTGCSYRESNYRTTSYDINDLFRFDVSHGLDGKLENG